MLVAALGVVLVRYAPSWWRRLRLRRRLFAALDAAASAAEVSQLLRLAVLERFPERASAGLTGAEWIAFLERCEGAPGRFAPLAAALTEAPYRTGGEAHVARLRAAARGWLRAVL